MDWFVIWLKDKGPKLILTKKNGTSRCMQSDEKCLKESLSPRKIGGWDGGHVGYWNYSMLWDLGINPL